MPGNPRGEPPGPGGPPEWLQQELFRHRIVLLTGRLDADAAARAAAQIVMLDATDEAPITMHLDSPDGTLEAAFVLIDTFDLVRGTVRVHCRGRVGGPAVGVVAAAGHRSAAPHTRFRLAQPSAEFSGTPDQILSYSQRQRELLWRFQARLAGATGRPAEEIADDMRRGRYLDAGEALRYGLIDAISPSPS